MSYLKLLIKISLHVEQFIIKNVLNDNVYVCAIKKHAAFAGNIS